MSEDSTTPEETAPEAVAPDEPFDADRAKAKIEKANREAAALRARLKEAEPLLAKAREFEEAQKTAEQRATEALTAAERRAVEAEAKLMRAEVAAEKGLTAAQAKRLVGSTRDELLADADEFLALMPAPPATSASRTPVEALRPGALPHAPAPSVDEQIAELMKDPKKNRRELIGLQNQKLREIATNRT
jgi:hypothetical protein